MNSGGRDVERAKGMGVTRGRGWLEYYLARRRADVADRLLPGHLRNGRLLDIGCGGYPLFLARVRFKEKFGLDRVPREGRDPGSHPRDVTIIDFDLEGGRELPFDADSFDAVTMLAVFEHIRPASLTGIVAEIFRVLRPGGLFVVTTPAPWTDGLLRLMARAGLVSREEIEEHKDVYGPRKIVAILRRGGFADGVFRYGFFGMFANVWLVATKPSDPERPLA